MHTDRDPFTPPPAEEGEAGAPRRPAAPVRGRGAVGNPQARFDRYVREATDDGWFGPEGDPPARDTRVDTEQARSVISRNTSPDIPFTLSLNPYRGCEHGCVYCYARPNHAHLGLSPGLDFETRLVAKVNAAQCLRAELAAPSYRCEALNLGTATDAYQPIEREWRITRAVLEVLAECAHPVALVTKSSLVERDLDLLAPMARRGLAAVYVSVTTLDPVLARRWEPRAAAPWRRLETIRRLSEAGVPVGVSVSPVVPFLNEPELERILGAAREAGASHAFYTVLRLPGEVRQVFTDWLRAVYPERAQRILGRLADMRDPSGRARLNDARFHKRMKGEGHWADLLGLRFQLAARKLGFSRDRLQLRTDLFVAPRADGQFALFPSDPAGMSPPDRAAPGE
ncbi:PA0069 family radical SAM protein [Quisquiliibacterium transsilvanicum]|uniref:DNA repair photolyase n=1 Tax=Quisquiliibacterium transsilvanicum TaxID=1549638 RepID=A0A7W8HHY8_9BURK|nr:PA0069 family radical SAM protein [Quisquiliibacterium transsilvanicum]MBB5272360.1 DNA repair photolyase [Quisquiliibacterium transsilvanicum]